MASARGGKASAKGSRARSVQQAAASSSSPAPQQGKQPPQTPTPASSSKNSASTRQKRVLPTRTGRGGPVVGMCESDVMILETMRRKCASCSVPPLCAASSPPPLATLHRSCACAHPSYMPARRRERTPHPRGDLVSPDHQLGARPDRPRALRVRVGRRGRGAAQHTRVRPLF